MYDNLCCSWDRKFAITIGRKPQSQKNKLDKYRDLLSQKQTIEDFQKHTAEIYKLFYEAEEYYQKCEKSKYNLLRTLIETGDIEIEF